MNIALCIGCDSYRSLPALCGAEVDAQTIFSTLTGATTAIHDPIESRLLLSPDLVEVQKALTGIRKGPHLDVFTVYFAGHGHVKSGAFHFCLRDSDIDSLSTTSFALTTLLDFVKESSPRHVNIVIDACESGGMFLDIQRSLGIENAGRAGTTGLTLLAACGVNEYALETNQGGTCTIALNSFLSGARFVNDLAPELGLLEISALLSAEMAAETGANQTPFYWGLNLSGHSEICRNRHISKDAPLREALASPARFELSVKTSKALWNIFPTLVEDWNPQSLLQIAELLKNDVPPTQLIACVNGLTTSLSAKAAESKDPFRKIEIEVVLLGTLMSLPVPEKRIAQPYLTSRLESISDRVVEIARQLRTSLTNEEFCLLSPGGISELFNLPIRVTSLLGWMSICANWRTSDSRELEAACDQLLGEYTLSVRTVSDEQAAACAIALSAMSKFQNRETGEQLAGLLFNSISDSRGLVARYGLDPSLTAEFLLGLESESLKRTDEIVARPTELLTTILVFGREIGLADEFDFELHAFDRVSINAFLTANPNHFCDKVIETGTNCTMRIGFDVWSCDEIAEQILLKRGEASLSRAEAQLSFLHALVLKDRVPWHLLPISDSRKKDNGD